MLVGGIRPHFYCLPILKRNTHQEALLDAAVSGNLKVFLGTDSAPHAHSKEAACGCAGCYSAYAAIEPVCRGLRTAQCAGQAGRLRQPARPGFLWLAAQHRPDHPGPRGWQAPANLPFGDFDVVPLRAGETLRWKLLEAGA